MPTAKQKQFKSLIQRAAECLTCPRMANSSAVLGTGNGSICAKVVFVSEAPSQEGGGRTGIPFYGDASGRNLDLLLNHIGLDRQSIFITNAVLCNPVEEGANQKPTAQEMKNCSTYLKSVLDLIQPKLIVTLGGVGLTAINKLFGTRFLLKEVVTQNQSIPPFCLLPLYHPSPRVVNTRRSLVQQKRDFEKISTILQKL